MTTLATPALPSEAIVRKADAELTTLQAEQANVQAIIAEAREEVRSTGERLQSLQEERSSLERTVQQVRSDFDQAQTYARLATGTPSESTAVARLAACKKSVGEASRTLSKFETAHGNEQTELPVRVAELQTKMTQGEERLSDLAQREQALQVARGQAFEALGRETLDAALAAVHAAQAEVDRRAEAFVEAKLRLSEAREEVERQLRPWADLHRRAITEYGVYEDASTRVLQAFCSFLEVLAADAPLMRSQINGYSLAAQIEMTATFAESIMRRSIGIEKQIESRRAGTQQLLHMYLREC